MVFLKKYFMDLVKRQTFCDAFAQIFSLILRPCHIQDLQGNFLRFSRGPTTMSHAGIAIHLAQHVGTHLRPQDAIFLPSGSHMLQCTGQTHRMK